MKKVTIISLVMAGALTISGCALTNTEAGAATGAVGGALIAKAVGGDTHDAITAASAGAVTGALIGKERDEISRGQ